MGGAGPLSQDIVLPDERKAAKNEPACHPEACGNMQMSSPGRGSGRGDLRVILFYVIIQAEQMENNCYNKH
jgi:hypothetical protein